MKKWHLQRSIKENLRLRKIACPLVCCRQRVQDIRNVGMVLCAIKSVVHLRWFQQDSHCSQRSPLWAMASPSFRKVIAMPGWARSPCSRRWISKDSSNESMPCLRSPSTMATSPNRVVRMIVLKITFCSQVSDYCGLLFNKCCSGLLKIPWTGCGLNVDCSIRLQSLSMIYAKILLYHVSPPQTLQVRLSHW